MGAGQTIGAGISQEVVDLLYLCGRALEGEPAQPERIRQMNLARVHALAEDQSLSALAWYGLESGTGQLAVSGTLIDAWRAERDRAVRRQMLFDAERAQIFAWMRDSGIWHAPLKGAVLADWYPRMGMREFSDYDILYDATRRADLVGFFKARGYHVNSNDHPAALDDSFTKEPVYNFEMHRQLFLGYYSHALTSYFDEMADRLVSVDGSPYCLRQTSEDFYLYLIAHARKHHEISGTGVRILCDLQVFLAHEGTNLDRNYVERQFDTLGIGEFGRALERLAACVFACDFDPEELRDDDLETLRGLTSHGTYGTIDHFTELTLEREKQQVGSAGEYVLKRIVPDDEWWKFNSPFGFKHKWARGPLLLFRAARAAVKPERRRRAVAELRAVIRKNREDSSDV